MKRSHPYRPKIDPILVTGASGFLGWDLCQQARCMGRVFGVVHTHRRLPRGVDTLALDLRDHKEILKCMHTLKPAAVIHAAAVTSPADCFKDPRSARALNVSATRTLGQACAELGSPLVFTSTDLVFNGLAAPYAETDPTDPASVYGRQKVAAENALRQVHPQATICRLPLLYGPPGASWHMRNFTLVTIERMLAGKPVTLFTDEYRTPVDTHSAARGLLWALHHPGRLLHLGGPQRISRAAFGLTAARLAGADPGLIIPNRQSQTQGPEPRAADVSLDSRLAFGLGYDPLNLIQGLRNTLDGLTAVNAPPVA